MAGFKDKIGKWLFFSEPKKVERFILKETKHETLKAERYDEDKKNRQADVKESEEQKWQSKGNFKKENGVKINKDLKVSLEYMKKIYSIPLNGDIMLREFDIVIGEKPYSAFIIFYDGLTDRMVINTNILQPLMLLSNLEIKSDEKNIGKYIMKHLLPQNQVKYAENYEEVINEVNFGGCGLFVDGLDKAFACDVKGWEHRGVERPNNELVLRGPQEGFNEVLRVNTALIRKILKDEDLIAEDISVGERSKTPCSMMYIKDIANDELVQEVRRRLKSIKVDYMLDTGQLEQLIEDKTTSPAPLIVDTERPDRVASMLSEGKVAVVLNGSPFVLVVPTTLPDLFHSAEDNYVRFPYANFLRIIRLLGVIMALLLPGLYISITYFHHEMIPTDLLFALEASREKVPFPSLVELLLMELAFELIREAGIRIPGPIGPTLGIIGALILGQAAVAANIVSPILIIIVAVTGIGSFAIPSFSLAFSFRIARFVYIILGTLAGFLGITLGIFLHMLWMAQSRSFGVPFLSPFAPRTADSMGEELIRKPVWKQEYRADFLNTKDSRKQKRVSRGWWDEDSRKKR